MKPSKEEITATVSILRLECISSFQPKPNEHHKVELFLASSRTSSKLFKFFDGVADFSRSPETLEVKSIVGTKIECWLSCTHPARKLIGVAFLEFRDLENSEEVLCLKLENDEFVKAEIRVNVGRRNIEKEVFVEPDEVILRKKIDPAEEQRRLEEEQRRRAREQQDMSAKELAMKTRPIITIQTQNRK